MLGRYRFGETGRFYKLRFTRNLPRGCLLARWTLEALLASYQCKLECLLQVHMMKGEDRRGVSSHVITCFPSASCDGVMGFSLYDELGQVHLRLRPLSVLTTDDARDMLALTNNKAHGRMKG